jgi:hypothetical protein
MLRLLDHDSNPDSKVITISDDISENIDMNVMNEIQHAQVIMYTFGSPRVGCPMFRKVLVDYKSDG